MPEPVPEEREVAQPDTGVDKAELGKAVIGIIYPPPELRNIVDKTASFVARNGPDFETRIKANEQGNRKFNFLKEGDPYHAYYLHKVKDFIEGKAQEPEAPKIPSAPAIKAANVVTSQAPTKKKVPAYEPIILKEPPPEPIFMLDPPSISAYELDVLKLTAQFVAKNGKTFLQTLIQKEQKNYIFDFLRPQHGHFQYFTKLVEQYSKILLPESLMLENLRLENEAPSKLLDKVLYKVEWVKYQERVRKKEQDDAEKERVTFAQIDWHDFVVVETIDFPVEELGELPPPVTPDELGARLIAQERHERLKITQEDMTEDEPIQQQQQEKDESTMDVEMEVEEDEPAPQVPDAVAAAEPSSIQISNVKVRKDYNPKARTVGGIPTPAPASDQWMISPITGERIRADQLQEHMRVALLDPRWREQRDRALEEKKRHEDPYAPGIDVSNTLKQLAERRTDIFGKGGEETMIGKKIGEEGVKQKESVQWDGHSSSMEKTKAKAKKNVTLDEQIEHVQRKKGLLPIKDALGPDLPKGGPSIAPLPKGPPPPSSKPSGGPPPLPQAPPPPAASAAPPPPGPPGIPPSAPSTAVPQPVIVRTAPVIVQPGPNLLQQAQMAQVQHSRMVQQAAAQQQQAQLQQQMMHQQLLTQQLARQQAAQIQQLAAGQFMHQQQDDHLAKRVRLDDNVLIPEADWLRRFPGTTEFTVNVLLPNQDSGDAKLNGQVVSVAVTFQDTIARIKSKVTETVGLSAGKQKITSPTGVVLKDGNSLAYFNLAPGANLTLRIKERGGKGK